MEIKKRAMAIVGLLWSMISLVSPANARTSDFSLSQVNGDERIETWQDQRQFIAAWLVRNRVMDTLSATELVLALNDREVSAMVKALKNPQVAGVDQELIPIKAK